MKIEYDEAVKKIIYSEGVYPTQGVRPIFTSIHSLIKSKLSIFISEILTKGINPNLLKLSFSNSTLICTYFSESRIIHKKQIELKTHLEDIRKNKYDDLQAITAVHESGHAILSSILLKTIPIVVYSVSSDANHRGFIYSEFLWDYISRKELVPRTALFLGGYVAEEIIFGKEYLTTGATSDIEKATEFLSEMLKQNGMGDLPINYDIPNSQENNSYHNYKPIEEDIKQMIIQALELAKKTLKKEKHLLLAMSNYLSDNRLLYKHEMEILINKHISSPINFITNGELLYYRKHLKKAVNDHIVKQPTIQHNAYVLNKEE